MGAESLTAARRVHFFPENLAIRATWLSFHFVLTCLHCCVTASQDKSICAAVVGLSVNLNVVDEAEKRIKSRFSFRQVSSDK